VIGAKPLFDGDHDHIHHKLLKRGLSQRAAVLVLYGATAGFGLFKRGTATRRADAGAGACGDSDWSSGRRATITVCGILGIEKRFLRGIFRNRIVGE